METSCKNLSQEHQEVVRDLMAEEDEELEISPTPSALHILDLPDSVIFQIFIYLPFSSIGAIAQACSRFSRISSDELLWRHVFLQHYKLSASTVMPAKARSWRQEFKRLYYHTPAVLSEERKEHKDEVLHVSFSHDGTMFATCSKDGFFKIWECTHPVRLLFKMDMKSTFSWKFTQFSQFNESDTCLLVSGVYFGRLSTSGEIAVFNLQDDFRMQCRVTNKPYDVFGAWYDNDHLLSGTLYWTGDFNSVSAVWLSKASQEVESEVESVSMVLYRFENVNSSSIRLLHVAEVDRDSDTSESVLDKEELEVSESAQTSPHSSSLGSREDVKIVMDVDSSTSRSEVEDKSQGQENAPVDESCMLDLLLHSYIAEDEFHVENGDDKSENGGNALFGFEATKGCEKMDYVNEPGPLLKSDDVQEIPKRVKSLNDLGFDINGAGDTEQIDRGQGNSTQKYLLQLQNKVKVQTGDGSSFVEGASSSGAWPASRRDISDTNIDRRDISDTNIDRQDISDTNIDPGLTQVSAASDQVRGRRDISDTNIDPGLTQVRDRRDISDTNIDLGLTQVSAASDQVRDRRDISDTNIDLGLTQVSAASDQVRDGHSQSLISCQCSPGFRSPEDQYKPHLTSTEAHEFNMSQHTAGSINSPGCSSSPSFASNNVSSTGVESTDCLSHRLSTFSADNPLVLCNTDTENNAKTPSQEFDSLSCGSRSSIPRPPMLPLFDALIDRTDVRIRTISASGSLDEGGIRISDILNTSSDANVDCMPEEAMDVGTEYVDVGEGNQGDASESFDVADGALVASTSDGVFEGASTSSCMPECSELAQNNFLTRDKFDISQHPQEASDNMSAAVSVVSVLESKPGARDVSQQVGHGFGSRDASVLNVPSLFDNNLVMLIPGASHVYGSRNPGIAAQNTNNSNASNHSASSNIDGILYTESDTVNVGTLVREAGTSHSHKSSIATQTEIASSRASSFHSLSHISQSSSISRDFRCSPPREKLLIYTWGSETYIPHKVGIKRMKWTDFTKGEVTARRSSMLLPDVMENLHNMAGNRRDKPDVTIEMHGHIVGLSLSPDHKYLYVNCRPWPKNYIISDPQESPPLAQEVEVSTIDLTTFNFVGPVLRSHKAYTHSDECFFLNLDVSDDYVASGAEDRQGYLWDRHYGIPLYRFPHRNVVNCVAINPQDSEILVTVSDDYTFKVWMSRCRASELTGSREADTGTSV